MELHRRAEVMQRGTDIQDLAASFFQLLERGAANIERPFQIYIDHRSETVWGKLLGRAKKVSGGAVDDDVDFAESFDGCGNCLLDFCGIANVGGDGKGFTDVRVTC